MNDNKLGWFLAGAVVGASIALLYAPKSGRDTRRYLKKATNEVESSSRDLMDRGKELYERGKEIADEAADLFERGRKLVAG